MADRVAYGSLPFKEQIAFFRAKRNVLTEAWTDLWLAEHDHAFMVAGANRIDLLVDLRAAVDRAIADGTGLEAFRSDFDRIVAKYGWAYNGGRNWRTRVIYETNLRTSYAAGRYSQLQALKTVRPFWRYRHSDAVQHPRPMHLAWNGLVLDADHPWWNTHFPPNGWGCQCTVEALNERDLKRLGKNGPDTAPPVDMQQVLVGKNGPHPRQVETPAGVDPGFGYAPGKSAFERGATPPVNPLARLAQDTLRKAGQLPALAGAEALAQLLANPRIVRTLSSTFSALQLLVLGAGLLATTEAPPDDAAVGALAPDLVRALAGAGITPAAAPIIGTPEAIGASQSADVPQLLAAPHAVLLDVRGGQLLYVDTPAADGNVHVAWVTAATGAQTANVYDGDDTVEVSTLQQHLDAGEFVLLQGAL
ncbi:phage head morphogenesis protein [Rhodanobacter sp. UC4450_H17]